MPRLFGRRTAITIGSIRVQEYLHFEFDATRSLKRDPNRLTARIYNLKADTRAAIEALDTAARVSLEAGYKTTQLAEIFRGNYVTSYTQRSGADLITTVEASDGGEAQFASHSKSFTRGTALRAAIENLVAAAKIEPGNLKEIFERDTVLASSTFAAARVVKGNAFTTIVQLLNGVGYGASLQNNQLQILKNEAALPGQAILLSTKTSLIGTPSVTTDNVTKVKRVRCESLMNTDIAPGKQVRLESIVATAHFMVERAQYRGGLETQDFGIAMEGPVIT